MKQTNLSYPDYSAYDIPREQEALRAFLRDSKLKIPENFLAGLRPGDVIDLYTNPPDMRQLYCNQEFKRLCSYSEEQMRELPFTKLFWRSDEVQMEIVRKATQVALHENEAKPWDIPNHELIESLHPRKRTFEIDLGLVAPCFNETTGQRVAFVSSLRVNLIFEWPEFQIPS